MQAVDELELWLSSNKAIAKRNERFFEGINELLLKGCKADTDRDAVEIAKIITHSLLDSGPQEVLVHEFLPSHTLICRAIEKSEKRGNSAS